MTAAPSNPFDLGTHLIDGHHQDPGHVDPMDADELRTYHADCHTSGMPDHEHED